MQKLDLKAKQKELYTPDAESAEVVDVPVMQFVMYEGMGPPDGEEAQQAFGTLFPVAYKLKFRLKERGEDYTVMPLEGLWWADDMQDFVNNRRESWRWVYMIRQPEWVGEEDFEQVVGELGGKVEQKFLDRLKLEIFHEGEVAQILHLGPFDRERETIQRLHEFISAQGGVFDGHFQRHHEIYLSDMRRVDPQKMRTILRQPFWRK
jgi:hypothetical protein